MEVIYLANLGNEREVRVCMNNKKEIVLSASEFREFVMDEWDWSKNFYESTIPYSPKAKNLVKLKK